MWSSKKEQLIGDVLDKCATSVNQSESGSWSLTLVNSKSLPVTGRLREDWMLFDAAISDVTDFEEWWRVLHMNSRIVGPAKFALSGNRSLRLRAEIPLDIETGFDEECSPEVERRLTDACTSLRAAFHDFGTRGQAHASDDSIASNDAVIQDVRRSAAEVDWPSHERDDRRVAFDLAAGTGFHQAILAPGDHATLLSTEMAAFERLSDASRRAMAEMLLTTSGVVRMARPSIHVNGEQQVMKFGVAFRTAPNPTELNHALSALSVACAYCSRELIVLASEPIACAYNSAQAKAGMSARRRARCERSSELAIVMRPTQ